MQFMGMLAIVLVFRCAFSRHRIHMLGSPFYMKISIGVANWT